MNMEEMDNNKQQRKTRLQLPKAAALLNTFLNSNAASTISQAHRTQAQAQASERFSKAVLAAEVKPELIHDP